MSYATLSDLKSYLAITSTADDALLTDMLERARQVIDTMTRTTFAVPADTTRRFGVAQTWWDAETQRGHLLLPPYTFLAAYTTILSEDGQPIPLTEVVPYPMDPPYTTLVRLGRRWIRSSSGEVQVTGRWGWSVTPPSDIVHATIRLAGWMYRQRSTGNDGDRPVVAEHGLVVLPSSLPRDIRDILSLYGVVV